MIVSKMNVRQQLRQTIRAARDQIDSATRDKAARNAAELLIHSKLFHHSQHIACYFSVNSEIETKYIIEAIWRAHKKCYLPILSAEKKGFLHFGEYTKNSPLIRNQFGIPEPECIAGHCDMPSQLDLVIVPLIAFDKRGNRLGTGAGYYDRTFAFKDSHAVKPILCGLAFSQQEVAHIDVEAWDVKCDFIFTEQNILGPQG